eukprot:4452419-Prymnesium_polylepis.1
MLSWPRRTILISRAHVFQTIFGSTKNKDDALFLCGIEIFRCPGVLRSDEPFSAELQRNAAPRLPLLCPRRCHAEGVRARLMACFASFVRCKIATLELGSIGEMELER